MENVLTQASTQWATRPSDERFLSLTDMHQFKIAQRENSKAGVVPNRNINIEPDGGDHKGLVITGPNGGAVSPTHWSFGQLASLAGAPASYMRKLPSELAADCLNYGLKITRDVEDVGVLLYKNGGEPELRAATGPNYGRVWDADVVGNLINYVGDGVTGDWRVPGEFGRPVTVDKKNTTLYASDRDMFVFLADEKNLIEIPGAGRNGESEMLARGFFVWNSEVGAKTFGISTFLFRYVCCNRMVWGARDVETVTIRHSSGAPHRFLEEAVPALENYSQSSASGVIEAVQSAREKRIDNVDDFLAKRFSKRQADLIQLTHEAEEGRPIETIWDATQGITAVARDYAHVDARVDLEREAGKVFDLAS